MHQLLAQKIRAYRVGDVRPVSAAWMDGDAVQPDEFSVQVPLTQEMVFAHTQTTVAPGVHASGCCGETVGVVRVRDEARNPGSAVLFVNAVARELGAVRYTYVTAHHAGFDLYTATLFFAP